MIEHVGGVQSGVPRRVVAPGANLLVVAFVRGEASIEGSQQCVCAILVPTLAVLPSLFAYSIPIGSPCFVMYMHMFLELDVMICKTTPRARFAVTKRLLVCFPFSSAS